MMARIARPARLVSAALLAAGVCTAAGVAVLASDQAIAITRFQATVGASTRLLVSDHVLMIARRQNGDEGPLSVGTIEFCAAARTASDGEVMLTVEPLAPIASLSGGASGTETTIAFEGSGDGAQSGALNDARPETVARWVGSGQRTGRLTFTLRGPVSPRGGVLPLRFLLAAP
jgi:hypothetical protein